VSAYCTLADVKNRLTGDVPNMGADFDTTITSIITQVSAEFDREVAQARSQAYPGFVIVSAGTSVVRRYTASPYSSLLLIDDAVAVSAVSILDQTGNVIQVLVSGTDYLPNPLNSLPITGLVMTGGVWPSTVGGVSVTLTPGIMSSISDDLHNAVIEESAQVYLSSQTAGGVAPKWLTDRMSLFVESYRYGGGFFRRPG